MKRVCIIFIVSLLVVIHAYGQTDSTISTVQSKPFKLQGKYRFGRLVLKWTPQQLLANFATVQLAAEQRLSRLQSIQGEGGIVVIPSRNIFDAAGTDKHGYKLRLQFRNYFDRKSLHWRAYLAPEVGYYNFHYNSGVTYTVRSENNLFYYQYVESRAHYTEVNGSFNAGACFFARRFMLELQGGIMGRLIKVTHGASPGSNYTVYDQGNDNFFITNTSKAAVIPNFVFRLGYMIR